MTSHWAIMLGHKRSYTHLLTILQLRRDQIQYYMIGPQETTKDGVTHWHAYMKLKRSQRKSWFGSISTEAWIRPLLKDPRDKSLNDSEQRYVQYVKMSGPPLAQHGTLFSQPRTNNSMQILKMIKEGYRMSEIVVEYPSMYATIAKLMLQRPKRVTKTDVLYLWGPTGVGKTSMVFRVLKTLQRLHLCDYYSKGSGLKKFWDGYDNQQIAWIDDPVSPDDKNDCESIQQLKNIMSGGDCFVEVKHGTMVFDSNLLIMTTNTDPMRLVVACGEENRDPIHRRLTDSCGAFCLGNVSEMHYKGLLGFIKESCGLDFNDDEVLKAMPPYEEPDYTDAQSMMSHRATQTEMACSPEHGSPMQAIKNKFALVVGKLFFIASVMGNQGGYRKS